MSAICKGCGKNVGCGCQLVNGLCAACRTAKKLFTHVNTKVIKLMHGVQ